jgi:hypothetical protein
MAKEDSPSGILLSNAIRILYGIGYQHLLAHKFGKPKDCEGSTVMTAFDKSTFKS